ncbi:hypothetical protein EP51_03965 [Rhodococcus opacus]|uniref:Uncharacterized protein n=1 Tax=Rhodococcus opacus TaxID=37919 RepID=A0A076EDT4_RHOOP|nr:hypothetical protein EP51_03965 [Rhodococcus opacus]
MLFETDEPEPGSGGHGSLWANDELIGEGDMPRTVPVAFSSYAGMDVGRDNGRVVDRDCEDRARTRSPEPSTRPNSRCTSHAAMQGVGHGAAG